MMSDMPSIPNEMLARAYRRPNGELAWRPDDAVVATEVLASAGYAVLGGEWWVVLPNGELRPFVPATKTGPSGVYGWSLRPGWSTTREAWEAFCERAAAYTIAVLRGEEPGSASLPAIEAEVRRERPDLWSHIWYNLTFVSREQYEATHERHEAP